MNLASACAKLLSFVKPSSAHLVVLIQEPLARGTPLDRGSGFKTLEFSEEVSLLLAPFFAGTAAALE